MAATLVMVLVMEWIGKMVSGVIGAPVSMSRMPKVLKYTGWPCCSISTIAPGIFPAAISLLKKSSMRASFSRDNVGWFNRGRTASAADEGIAAIP